MNPEEFSDLENCSNKIGNEMFQLMVELYPICRSITGNGVRESLQILSKHIPLKIHEIKTGTTVYDWTIPKEWNINNAYLIDPSGKKIVDFKKSNLHVVNYSVPINIKLSLEQLAEHIHTIPEKPDQIPYVTSYYHEDWGFCMTHNEFKNLPNGEYHAVIDASLTYGSLTYGEYFIQGKTDSEILLSTYICHPSLCNDNLSGVVLTTFLAKYLSKISNEYSIRFLFVPETIGAITWLCLNEEKLAKIKHGLVVTCVGDPGIFTYKKSRQDNAEIDQTVLKVLENSSLDFKIYDFFPWGSDERQFCSPGINLPVGSLTRTLFDDERLPYSAYHTSADNLEFIKKEALSESFVIYLRVIRELEQNFRSLNQNQNSENTKKIIEKKESLIKDNRIVYQNLNPKCEPMLSKRGLYSTLGGQYEQETRLFKFAIFWVLNLSDGTNSLYDISKRSKLDLKIITKVAELLENHNILKHL